MLRFRQAMLRAAQPWVGWVMLPETDYTVLPFLCLGSIPIGSIPLSP